MLPLRRIDNPNRWRMRNGCQGRGSGTVVVVVFEGTMVFGREQLNVYRFSVYYVAWAYALTRTLKGADRHARDQLVRASQSIPLNIAEGNGKDTNAD